MFIFQMSSSVILPSVRLPTAWKRTGKSLDGQPQVLGGVLGVMGDVVSVEPFSIRVPLPAYVADHRLRALFVLLPVRPEN